MIGKHSSRRVPREHALSNARARPGDQDTGYGVAAVSMFATPSLRRVICPLRRLPPLDSWFQ
jgi:hypothetical protein